MEEVKRVIEKNNSLKVLREKLDVGRGKLCRLKDSDGITREKQDDILKIIEKFYNELYKSNVTNSNKR